MPPTPEDQFTPSSAYSAHEVAYTSEVVGGGEYLREHPDKREEYYVNLAKRFVNLLRLGATPYQIGPMLQLLASHGHELEAAGTAPAEPRELLDNQYLSGQMEMFVWEVREAQGFLRIGATPRRDDYYLQLAIRLIYITQGRGTEEDLALMLRHLAAHGHEIERPVGGTGLAD